MLHIIWIVLKIIGMVLLVILGLIFGIFLLILLVPIRYRIKASYYENLKGVIKITWLLHIVSIQVEYDKESKQLIRIFGIRIGSRKKETIPTLPKETEYDLIEAAPPGDENPEEISEDELVHATSIPDTPPKTTKQIGILEKFKKKLSAFFRRLKLTVLNFYNKLQQLRLQKEKLQAILADEENRKTVRLIFRQSKYLLRHIFPRKSRGKLTFGFDDPYTTGQLLSAISLVYPFCHKQMEFDPVFDQVILEGECHAIGHIRIGTCFIPVLRVYGNKNFRKLLKQWQK